MTTQHASNRNRRLVGVVLLALLVAQWSALLHAVAHAPALSAARFHHATPQAAGAEAAASDTTDHRRHAGHSDHSDHEAGSSVCQLFDQLLLGQAPGSNGPPVIAAPWRQEAPQAQRPSATPRTAATPYEARGPPRA